MTGRKAVRGAFVLASWAALILAAPSSPLSGQAAVDLDATVDAGLVRVGEPFVVRLSVAQDRGGEVQFPATLNVPDFVEQVGPVQIRSLAEGRDWAAEYTVVAWRADTLAFPPSEIELAGAGGVVRVLRPPVVEVRSVLPPESGELDLRGARPLLQLQGFPWAIIALVAAAGLLVWWWARRRNRGVAPAAAVVHGPGDIALRDLARLREAWLERRLTGDRFYDRYEATLRRYLRATRRWPPSRELLGLGASNSRLFSALGHSVLARFARLRTPDSEPVGDIAAGEEFVRSEQEPDPPPGQTEQEDAGEPGEAADSHSALAGEAPEAAA